MLLRKKEKGSGCFPEVFFTAKVLLLSLRRFGEVVDDASEKGTRAVSLIYEPCFGCQGYDVAVDATMRLDDMAELGFGDEIFVFIDQHDSQGDVFDEVVGVVGHVAVTDFVEAEYFADVVEYCSCDDHVAVDFGSWHGSDEV